MWPPVKMSLTPGLESDLSREGYCTDRSQNICTVETAETEFAHFEIL